MSECEHPDSLSLSRAGRSWLHCVITWLCLLGANELAVQKAKTEITRLIKEELIRLVSIFCFLLSG